MPRTPTHLLAASLALSACTDDPEWDLPPLVASSQYIDYRAWTGPMCMDTVLEEWDSFVADTATFLDAPARRVEFVWVPPEFDAPTRWGCDGGFGCFVPGDDIIFSRLFEHHHEVVHALEVPHFPGRHSFLIEGMATYLSEWEWVSLRPESPPSQDEFARLITDGPRTREEYAAAAHFVGWVIERHGMERYRDLAARWPAGGDYADLEVAYAAAIDADLAADLIDIGLTEVYGRRHDFVCDPDTVAPVLPWGPGQSFALTLSGECGDIGPTGPADPADPLPTGATLPGFIRVLALDIPESGAYALRFGPAAAALTSPTLATAALRGCPDANFSPAWTGGDSVGVTLLEAGRYRLEVNVPPRPDSARDIDIFIDYIAPP